MNKKMIRNRIINFIVCASLAFFLGYMFCLLTASGHMTGSGQENGAAQKEIPAEYRAESSEEESIQEEETDALSEEDRAFLEEHIYGQWRFADRIVELDQNNNIHNGGISNISDVGIEELKRTVVICYEDDCFWCPVDIGQNTFSYAQDMYLFGMYNGFSWTQDPVYSINEMDTDTIYVDFCGLWKMTRDENNYSTN